MDVLNIIILVILIFLFYSVNESKKGVPARAIVFQIVIISSLQVIWSVAYMFPIYVYDNFISRLLYLIAGSLSLLVFYKGTGRIGYWLCTNIIISPLLSLLWIEIDNSPFDGFMGSVGQWVTPFSVVVVNMMSQIGIWLFVKFYKWLGQGE